MEENSTSGNIEKGLGDLALDIYLHDWKSSQFLVTPTKSLVEGDLLSEFSRAMMTTSTSSDQLGLLSDNTSLHTLTNIQERQQLEGLTEQISQVEQLVAKVIFANMEPREHAQRQLGA